MKEVIGTHGWGSQSDYWLKWMDCFKDSEWIWQNYERGYGEKRCFQPTWKDQDKSNSQSKRAVICHSLGTHFIDNTILANATHVILISSFSRFIVDDKNKRLLKAAILGMLASLGTSKEREMLNNFLQKSSYPNNIDSLSISPIHSILSPSGREKLKQDLQLLINTFSLPKDFPSNAKVLVIHGVEDAIVSPSAKAQLINDLVEHQNEPPIHWEIKGVGHSLMSYELITKAKNWLEL